MEKSEIVEPSENIKEFKEEGNKLTAVFYTVKDAYDYIKEYSLFSHGAHWWDKVGFADFSHMKGSNEIIGHSTYHPIYSIKEMFENGLKF